MPRLRPQLRSPSLRTARARFSSHQPNSGCHIWWSWSAPRSLLNNACRPVLLVWGWDDLVVQGRSGEQRELLEVESVAGHLLPAGSVFAFLAAHRRGLFPDSMFSDLFPSGRGRPSVPVDVVATVLVLQALHHLSDREAAEAVTFNLRWKAAVGLPITAGRSTRRR